MRSGGTRTALHGPGKSRTVSIGFRPARSCAPWRGGRDALAAARSRKVRRAKFCAYARIVASASIASLAKRTARSGACWRSAGRNGALTLSTSCRNCAVSADVVMIAFPKWLSCPAYELPVHVDAYPFAHRHSQIELAYLQKCREPRTKACGCLCALRALACACGRIPIVERSGSAPS